MRNSECLTRLGSLLLRRYDGILASLGDSEFDHGLGRNLDGSARLRVPPHARLALGYAEVARAPMDRPIACAAVAASVKGGRARGVRAVLSGAGQPLALQPRAAASLDGVEAQDLAARVQATSESIHCDWVDDIRASAEYRAAIMPVLIRRALEQLFANVG